MIFETLIVFTLLCVSLSLDEECARKYLEQLNEKSRQRLNKVILSEWEYASNITEENLKLSIEVSANISKAQREDWEVTTKMKWRTLKDETLKRQFRKLSNLETEALPQDDFIKLTEYTKHMENVYSTAKLCSYQNRTKCDLELNPDIVEILAHSNDPEEQKYYWLEWRNAVGINLKDTFVENIKLVNTAARINNFSTATNMWLDDYDPEDGSDIRIIIEKLWNGIRPLYLQIHAYVRFKLRQKYGCIVSERGPIPAHLLGNMWGQYWDNLYSFTLPYPESKLMDPSDEMRTQGYTPKKIFEAAEDFFTSISLYKMTDTFWKKTIMEKPTDREIVCHGSAWDFRDGEDFRIKMCTLITYEDYSVVHHEMGHVEYFMAYKDLPIVFRGGANPGFHESVGDTIGLSVKTIKHLKKIGLLKNNNVDEKQILNNLFLNALRSVPLVPLTYVTDLWRWDIFDGKTKPEQYNCAWWKLRNDIQGLEPPEDRSENNFDPISKYHVTINYPCIAYFISDILLYQFHRSLCLLADEFEPGNPSKLLHECDIYGSMKAGEVLKRMLSMGKSKPWPDALEVLTGQRELDSSPFLEYFEPLMKWLVNENEKNKVFIGWEAPTKTCK